MEILILKSMKLSLRCLLVSMAIWTLSAKGQIIRTDPPLATPTNSFFDNDTLFQFELPSVYVAGEVEHPGPVSFTGIPLRSVIVKEAHTGPGGVVEFTGAYRYEGYALTDILNPFVVKKANREAFPPLTDLYIKVFNNMGDTVVVSWGELYYANRPEGIMIATRVMRIVPEKTLERWPLPGSSRLIIPNDLRSDRNIPMPTGIVVVSCTREMVIEKGKFPMQADSIILDGGQYGGFTLKKAPLCDTVSVHTIFYGKGRGLHSTEPVSGSGIPCLLSDLIPLTAENLKCGLVLFGADDGYRAVFSLSELVNRNDQEHTLLLYSEDGKGNGRYRLYPSCDFFSDRAIKGITNIWFSNSSQ